MKFKYTILFSIFVVAAIKTNAQGCVAIRGTMASCTQHVDSAGWRLNLNNRYFKSYKHFIGTKEQKERVEKGSEVINHTYELDVIATKIINRRWSVSFILPILNSKRSSLYEHDAITRHATRSFGIGDMRIAFYNWLVDPKKKSKGNIQVGVGVKLATGDYKYQDYFFKKTDSSIIGPVDQSIQLGDGGTGLTFELNGFVKLSSKLAIYGNSFYLINPREVNGTSTTRGSAASATAKKYNTDVMSVPDLFMARGGASFSTNKLTVSGGIRIEGLPSSDLIGGSRGFRRPGYIISAEPSFSYQAKKFNIDISAPIALVRNRTQSNSDKRRTIDTGTKQQGDAAFADYSINAGISFKL